MQNFIDLRHWLMFKCPNYYGFIWNHLNMAFITLKFLGVICTIKKIKRTMSNFACESRQSSWSLTTPDGDEMKHTNILIGFLLSPDANYVIFVQNSMALHKNIEAKFSSEVLKKQLLKMHFKGKEKN